MTDYSSLNTCSRPSIRSSSARPTSAPSPCVDRRKQLEDVPDGAPALLLPVRRLADEGLRAWAQVFEHGWEGLVAKDPESPHLGGRSLRWLKVKQRDYRVVERGWHDAERSGATR